MKPQLRRVGFLLLTWLTSLVSSIPTEPSGISINSYDGGYTGIVFKIKDQVPEEYCAEILQNLQIMLSDASRSLYTAMNRRVYFNQVTVVVPSTWRDAKCKIQIHVPRSGSSYGAPDFFVGTEDSVHGKSPFTQQSKGCGHRGDFTSIPFTFLTNWNSTWETFGDPSRVFVHEWSKLRYGIFDQHGFPNDPVYPAYFKLGLNDVVPTGTSDVRLSGRWLNNKTACDPTDTLSDKLCTFQLDMGENAEATCSLGYIPFLSGINRYCLADEVWNYNLAVMPTKHNGLCGGRSAMDVILQHPDLRVQSPRTPKVNVRSTPPKPVSVRVVREPRTKYVLVMESSSSMIRDNLWKWVSKAAQKFIRYDLPVDARLSIITFNNESTIHHRLTELSDEKVRARLADTIPDKYKVQRSPNERCVLCGFDDAMKRVLLGNGDLAAGAHIILVTRGDTTTLTQREASEIQSYVKENKIKVSSILVPENRNKPLDFYDEIAQASGGKSYVFRATSSPIGTQTFHQITESFKDLRKLDTDFPSDVAVTVYSQATTRAVSLTTKGSFSVDSTLGRETVFGILVDDVVNHYINSVTFTDSDGQKYGPYSSFTNDYNVINFKTINFPQDSTTPPFDDPAHLRMTWKYEVNWYDGGEKNLTNVIVIESKPRDLGSFGLVDVESWVEEDPSSIEKIQKPLKVFAKVTRGNGPVLAANVHLNVEIDLPNGSKQKLDPIKLLDNGNGDADITSGDGIYSHYLTTYPAPGRYSFSVTVDDNDGQAYTIQMGRGGRSMPVRPDNPSFPVCCGSQVTVPQDLRFLTGSFKRQAAKSPVVHINDVTAFTGRDAMPPSRIGNFRLSPDESGRRLVAHWTAPGDDYDSGSVSGYSFVYSDEPFALLDGNPAVLHQVERRDAAGSEATYSFTFNKFDKNYHVAIYGVDEAGNRGNVSNIVTVNLPAPQNPGAPEPEPEDGKAKANWLMVGVIAGVIVAVLLLLLLTLYIYFFVVRRRQRRGGVHSKSSGVNVDLQHNTGGGGGSEHTDASSFDEVKNSSSNHLVPTISTISSAYKQTAANGGNSFGNGLTPTYWSASQLLKGHEERKRLEEEEVARMAAVAAVSGTVGHHRPEMDGMNMGYDYNSDQLHQYGYYPDAADPAAYPVNYDPQYFQHYGVMYAPQPDQGYPIDYPPAEDYHIHTHPGGDQFNLTVEGSSDADESALIRSALNGSNNNLSKEAKPDASGATVPKLSGSDNSSSGTLGVVNSSLQGSLLSVNSGRPPSTVSKTRNITQV